MKGFEKVVQHIIVYAQFMHQLEKLGSDSCLEALEEAVKRVRQARQPQQQQEICDGTDGL